MMEKYILMSFKKYLAGFSISKEMRLPCSGNKGSNLLRESQ